MEFEDMIITNYCARYIIFSYIFYRHDFNLIFRIIHNIEWFTLFCKYWLLHLAF